MPTMTPQERATLCGQCTLARCNEQSRNCLIKIHKLERKVNRPPRTSAAADFAVERTRLIVVNRAINELLIFRQLSPRTREEMLAPHRDVE